MVVKQASGCNRELSLHARGNATGADPEATFEEDARKVAEFLHTLPSGTVDRAIAMMLEDKNTRTSVFHKLGL